MYEQLPNGAEIVESYEEHLFYIVLFFYQGGIQTIPWKTLVQALTLPTSGSLQ